MKKAHCEILTSAAIKSCGHSAMENTSLTKDYTALSCTQIYGSLKRDFRLLGQKIQNAKVKLFLIRQPIYRVDCDIESLFPSLCLCCILAYVCSSD